MSRKRPSTGQSLIAVAAHDDALRASLDLLLRAAGFEVLAYAGEEALLADPAAQRAAWLLIDQSLPGMGGTALVRTMRDRGWDGIALLMLEHEDGRVAIEDPHMLVLEKPFDATAIMAVVRLP